MMRVNDYDDTMSLASSTVSSSATTTAGRVVTHQSSQMFADPEQLRQCPFDPVHVIQAYRYQRHILRCRKQNPEKAKDFRDCKYNAMHFYHKDQIEAHHAECPDRVRIDRTVQSGPIMKSITDDINLKMDMWDVHESAGRDDLIRPKRQDILKLKAALREKYPKQEYYFDDGESESQSYFD